MDELDRLKRNLGKWNPSKFPISENVLNPPNDSSQSLEYYGRLFRENRSYIYATQLEIVSILGKSVESYADFPEELSEFFYQWIIKSIEEKVGSVEKEIHQERIFFAAKLFIDRNVEIFYNYLGKYPFSLSLIRIFLDQIIEKIESISDEDLEFYWPTEDFSSPGSIAEIFQILNKEKQSFYSNQILYGGYGEIINSMIIDKSISLNIPENSFSVETLVCFFPEIDDVIGRKFNDDF